ncbi:MAG: SPOR domain-containing protein [bacterium]
MKNINMIPKDSMPEEDVSVLQREIKRSSTIKTIPLRKRSRQNSNLLKFVTIFLLFGVVSIGVYFIWQFYSSKNKPALLVGKITEKKEDKPIFENITEEKSIYKEEVPIASKVSIEKFTEELNKDDLVKVDQIEKKELADEMPNEAPSNTLNTLDNVVKINPVKKKEVYRENINNEIKDSKIVSTQSAQTKEGEHFVIVSTFVFKKNASKFLAELRSKGFYSYEKIKKKKQKMYSVFLGPFEKINQVEVLRRELKKEDINSSTKKNNEGGTLIRVGLFYYKQNALEMAANLNKKDYQPTIGRESIDIDVYQVRVGNFRTYAEAKQQQSLLEEKEYRDTLIF